MLKKVQRTILETVFSSEIKKIAAWGGGTALSENYLHFSLGNLIIGVEKKFSEKIDTGILLANLTESLKNFSTLELMLTKKVPKKELSDFFQNVFNDFIKKKRL